MKSIGSSEDDRLAAEIRLAEGAQRRVCEMRRVAMSGCPMIAMIDDDDVAGGEVREREAV